LERAVAANRGALVVRLSSFAEQRVSPLRSQSLASVEMTGGELERAVAANRAKRGRDED